MKINIGLISDFHTTHHTWEGRMDIDGKLDDLRACDIICFLGDMSGKGARYQCEMFLDWFRDFVPSAKKVFIAGNHDYFFDAEYRSRGREDLIKNFVIRDPKVEIKELLKMYPDIIYLNDSGVEIMGLKFWGSPIQPWFLNWAFNRVRGEDIKKHWDLIPEDTDVLLVHGPPYGLGDKILPKFQRGGETPYVGCKDLLEQIYIVQPKVVAYGHIHEGYGVYTYPSMLNTTFINASSVNADYSPVNPPIVIEVDNGK